MKFIFKNYIKPINHLLSHCGNLKYNETLVIICDPSTRNIASLFADQGSQITSKVKLLETPLAKCHGQEPIAEVATEMFNADLIIGLTSMSMAHTQARVKASDNSARYLSLPDYSFDLLEDASVIVDFKSNAPIVKFVSDSFTSGNQVHITTKAGTDISLDISGRLGNYCPGFVNKDVKLASPPDIEANVPPVEGKSQGIVVIDGSITCPEIGLLTDPVILTIDKGFITNIQSTNGLYVRILEEKFSKIASDKAYILAECGVGLNEYAKLTGMMLTDEGAAGCVHFGFGSNSTIGGKNNINFHLDFVFTGASMNIDNIPILSNGRITK